MIIRTEFDNPLEQDIAFEETEAMPSYKDLLKNSENLMKSFLYLKKIFSISPFESSIVKVETVLFSARTQYQIEETVNYIAVKNVKDEKSSIFINDGELVLLPFESFEFPVDSTMIIEFIGNLSIIQSNYTIG